MFPFFYCGALFGMSERVKSLFTVNNTVYSIAFVAFFALQLTDTHTSVINLTGLPAIIILMNLFSRYDCRIPQWLSTVGTYSLEIYVFQASPCRKSARMAEPPQYAVLAVILRLRHNLADKCAFTAHLLYSKQAFRYTYRRHGQCILWSCPMCFAGMAEGHIDYSVGFHPTFTRSVWIMAEGHIDYSVGFHPTFTRSVWIMAESHSDYISVVKRCVSNGVWPILNAFQA